MLFVVIIFTTLLVLNAALLIGVIMLQGPQDDSAGAVAAYKAQHMKMLGAAQAPNILEKATSILATSLLVLVLATSYVMKRHYDEQHGTTDTLAKVGTYVITDEEKVK